jgi:hypothetical protein
VNLYVARSGGVQMIHRLNFRLCARIRKEWHSTRLWWFCEIRRTRCW